MSIEVRIIDGREWKYCTCCHIYKGKQRCQYCGKGYKTPKGLREHEPICYLNPKRECLTCKGEGEVFSGSLHADGAGRWDDCPDCTKAKERQAERAEWGDEWPRVIG